MEFSVPDAALCGFRVVRERPKAVVLWAILQIMVSVPFGIAMVSLYGPVIMKLKAAAPASRRDPAEVFGLIAQIAPMYLLSLAFFLVVYAVVLAAMNRAVMRPNDDDFGYLRLGGDEVRQFLLLVLTTLVMAAAYVVAVVAAGLIGTAAGAIYGLAAGGAVQARAVLMVAVMAVVVVAAMAALAVRLSLASPMTFASGRVALFGAWRLSRGRFWPILRTYLLVALMVLLVYALGYAVILATAAAAGGGVGALTGLFFPDLASLQTFLSPARWIELVLHGVLSALIWPLLFTPAAFIYRSLAGAGRVAEVFA
ncbi:MAG: hypothetical protein ACYC8V_10160 [Caulobacteraceae bacterium]